MFFDFTLFLLRHTYAGDFQGLPLCRMAAYFAQCGRCYVTGRILESDQRELHHRLPRSCGGKDTAENTILLNKNVHKLVHAKDPAVIKDLMQKIQPTEQQLHMINQLRYEARGLLETVFLAA